MTATAVIQMLTSAERVWFALPQFPRFVASGGIGNVILFLMDESFNARVLRPIPDKRLPKLLRGHRESISFFVAYFFQIVAQHFLHAVLVFGRHTIDTRERYLYSLVACYKTLFGILCGSTLCNALLLKWGVPKAVAFWMTLYGFGLVSYAILRIVASLSTTKGGDFDDATKTHPVPRGGGDNAFGSRRCRCFVVGCEKKVFGWMAHHDRLLSVIESVGPAVLVSPSKSCTDFSNFEFRD